MNKPITLFCGAIAAVGFWVLGSFFYYVIAYGDGNFEAGNYNRCRYWSETNAATGAIVKRWERRWELTDSTERGSYLYDIEVWIIGVGLLFVAAAVWVLDWSSQRERRI